MLYVLDSVNGWVSQIELLILVKVLEAENNWWDSFVTFCELQNFQILNLKSSK